MLERLPAPDRWAEGTFPAVGQPELQVWVVDWRRALWPISPSADEANWFLRRTVGKHRRQRYVVGRSLRREAQGGWVSARDHQEVARFQRSRSFGVFRVGPGSLESFESRLHSPILADIRVPADMPVPADIRVPAGGRARADGQVRAGGRAPVARWCAAGTPVRGLTERHRVDCRRTGRRHRSRAWWANLHSKRSVPRGSRTGRAASRLELPPFSVSQASY